MEDLARRRLIAIYLTNWSQFVERVRAGFDGSFTDYVGGVVARAQLESALKVWKGNRADDPVDEVRRLDRVFDESTEPLKWLAGRNIMVPSPNAKRWWRRPKWLIGSLREYFLVHGERKA